MARASVAAAVVVVGCLLAGCGERVATVSGVVKVDGAPLEKGAISFVPAEGDASPAVGEVNGGAYKLQMSPGKKIVQVTAPRVIGRRKEYNGPTAPEVDITEESLPPKYNATSELTFDVSGSATKDWELESIKPVAKAKGKR